MIKVLTSYVMAVVTIVLVYAAGATLGVRLAAGDWLRMPAFTLTALAPFAAIGVLFGHVMTTDWIGPAIGGTTAVFALLGGIWFPVTHGAMRAVAEALPSYWLVQAGHVGLGGHGWDATGWAVVAAWTFAAGAAGRGASERETRRAAGGGGGG